MIMGSSLLTQMVSPTVKPSVKIGHGGLPHLPRDHRLGKIRSLDPDALHGLQYSNRQ
jgi:hypothetical protein